MAPLRGIVIVGIASLVTSLALVPERSSLRYSAEFSGGGTAIAAVIEQEPRFDNGRFSFRQEDVRITQIDEFQRIELVSAELDNRDDHRGQPQLPYASHWLVLPDHSRIDRVEVTIAAWDTLPGRYLPPPVGYEDPDDPALPDPLIYESRTVYPPVSHELVKDDYHRGIHLGQVLLYPVRYSAVDQRLLIAREMTVTLSLRPLTSDEEAKVVRIHRPEVDTPRGDTRTWIRSIVSNPAQLDELYGRLTRTGRDGRTDQFNDSDPYGGRPTEWPSPLGVPVQKVIITGNQTTAGEPIGDVLSWASMYADWNTDRGVETMVFEVKDILNHGPYHTGDAPAMIRAFVLDCIEQWGTSYFVLAGDINVVPTRRLGGPQIGSGPERIDPPHDAYYVFSWGLDWNKDDDPWQWEDDFLDVSIPGGFHQGSIGRLPIRHETDAETIFKKLIEYREPQTYGKVPPPPVYYHSAFLAAGMTNSGNPLSYSCGYKAAQLLYRGFLNAWPSAYRDLDRVFASVPEIEKTCEDGPTVECYGPLRDSLATWRDLDDPADWSGSMLFDHLNGGYHFAFHIEHSDTDRLGNPTVEFPEWGPCANAVKNASWNLECYNALDALVNWDNIQNVTLANVGQLTNATFPYGGGLVTPRYTIVMSLGSFVNAVDKHTVSEALMQHRGGGAVAVIAKTQSYETSPFYHRNVVDRTLNPSVGGTPHLGPALLWAVQEVNPNAKTAARKAGAFNLLGDPGMEIFRARPENLYLSMPSPVAGLGSNTLTFTVQETDGTGPVVEGALVCLRQDSLSYAVAVTDVNGIARFSGFQVLSASGIQVSASEPDHFTAMDTLDVSTSAGAFLAYDQHIVDDGGTHGDDDGILERGESARVRVILRNRGTTSATAPSLAFRPSPPVLMDLDINGEFRPDEIFIGAKNSSPPPAVTDTFRVPVTWEGISVHGEPNATSVKENLKVWRKHQTGEYVISARSPSASTDSVFTGILKTFGGFSNVTLTGEGGQDSYYLNGDSLWFQFKGDATEDKITFRAEAKDWLSINSAAQGFLPSVAPGDTIGWWFNLDFNEKVVDRLTLPFTISAVHNGTTNAHSDLGIDVRGPDVDIVLIDQQLDSISGCAARAVIRPTLWNSGSGEADSVVVIVRTTAGTATVSDSVCAFGNFDPGEFHVPVDSIVVCASDSTALANSDFDIDLRVLYPQARETLESDGFEGGGSGFLPCKPIEVRAEARGRAVTLTWSLYGIGSACEGITHYLIRYWDPALGRTRVIAHSGEPARYDVVQIDGLPLDPVDTYGDPIEYTFAVQACRDGECGPPSDLTLPVRSWLPENEGWPKVVPSVVTTPPLVIEIDGREAVFVAGRSIYGWWLEAATGSPAGTPVRGNSFPDGLFYDPGLPNDQNALFSEALVELPLEDHLGPYGVAIVGSVYGDAIYCVWPVDTNSDGSYEPHLHWKRGVRAGLTAPTVARLNLESTDGYQVILPGRSDTLYVWMDDGDSYLTSSTPQGAYALNRQHPDSPSTPSYWNARSIAILPSEEDGKSYIVQSHRRGNVVAWDVPARSSTSLAGVHWACQVEPPHVSENGSIAYALSAPAIGDVDGDGEPEVVVTDNEAFCPSTDCGEVFVLSAADGCQEASFATPNWKFSDSEAPTRPILACLDPTDNGVEIVVGATIPHSPDSDQCGSAAVSEVTEQRAFVLVADGAGIDTTRCAGKLVIPHRFGFCSTRSKFSSEIVTLEGSEGSPQILGPSEFAQLVSWDWTEDCEPTNGWPVLLDDRPHTPTLTADGILVSELTGLVHYYQTSENPLLEGGWNQYGYDSRNTGYHPGCPEGEPRPLASFSGVSLRASPEPHPGSQTIVLRTSSVTRTTLSIFDVSGRRVRTLVDGPLAVGEHVFEWNGRNDRGHLLPSGTYFYRADCGEGQPCVRRTVIVR